MVAAWQINWRMKLLQQVKVKVLLSRKKKIHIVWLKQIKLLPISGYKLYKNMDPQSHSNIGMAFCFVSLSVFVIALDLMEAGIKKNFQTAAPVLFIAIIN